MSVAPVGRTTAVNVFAEYTEAESPETSICSCTTPDQGLLATSQIKNHAIVKGNAYRSFQISTITEEHVGWDGWR
jgi:hypothetical protein